MDEALFGLGEHRYEALVDLLIQLRQPQLSKRPDEKALSRALTEALPPLDPALVADVAEAFRGLDEEREALTAMAEARDAAAAFLKPLPPLRAHRHAAPSRLPARRRRAATSSQPRARRGRGATAAGRGRLVAARATRRGTAAAERTRLKARDAALRESPEMRGRPGAGAGGAGRRAAAWRI